MHTDGGLWITNTSSLRCERLVTPAMPIRAETMCIHSNVIINSHAKSIIQNKQKAQSIKIWTKSNRNKLITKQQKIKLQNLIAIQWKTI